jgi:hypothetical protein
VLTVDQVVTLADAHGLQWTRATIEHRVYPLVGGHPYLLRSIMHRARTRNVSFASLEETPSELDDLFGGHLGRLGRRIEGDSSLKSGFQSILKDAAAAIDEDVFQRLRREGLITHRSNGEHRVRNQLYESYFRRRWNLPKP